MPAQAPLTPSFKGYLFWYAILQLTIATASCLCFFAYGYSMTALGIASAPEVEAQMAAIQRPVVLISAGLFIGLAVIIAKRHGVGFLQGVGGWLLGNVVTYIAIQPLIQGIAVITKMVSPPAAGYLDLALIALYGVVIAIAIVWKRREALSRRRHADLIEPFS